MKSATALYFTLMLLTAGNVSALPDPTQPPMGAFYTEKPAGKSPTGFDLTSILIAKDRRIAVINDQPVSTGDSIGNGKVKAIAPDHVVIGQGGRDIKLNLIEAVRQDSRTIKKTRLNP